VLLKGAETVGKKLAIKEWQELLEKGMNLSLVEHDRVSRSYRVTPLLQDELLSQQEDCQDCHEAAFEYYEELCDGQPEERFDPVAVEEWVYHSLGCGKEEVASRQGGELVQCLHNHLAFRESKRVGLWVLAEKKKALATEDDAFLLNRLTYTFHSLREYHETISYFEQALEITKKVHGENHQTVATALNNLGEAYRALGKPKKAIRFFKQAQRFWKKNSGMNLPIMAASLTNLGGAWQALNKPKKAIRFFEKALSIDETKYGREHPEVATDLNNLGGAWQALRKWEKAIGFFKHALSIDETEYGREHPKVARDLSNLGYLYFQMGERKKAKPLLEEAYRIFKRFFGEEHPNTKGVAEWLGLVMSSE
jgi:tetratricopeptide (TPR) repeat protein